MLTRRHIRAIVLQSLYGIFQCQNDNMDAEEKKLLVGIEKINELFICQIDFLCSVRRLSEKHIESRRKKRLATPEELDPNTKFIENRVFLALENDTAINGYIQKKGISWKNNGEYVENILEEIEACDRYKEYMASSDRSFGEDKGLALHIFKRILAPNETISDYYEDRNMSWVADYEVANTMLLKTLDDLKEDSLEKIKLPALYKDDQDRKFAVELLRKTAANSPEWHKMIEEKAKNWESERIALTDFILMEMAITEFVSFPSIPTKVSLNEYIEVSKEYSTPKSGIFINGILDKILQELEQAGRIKKSGRGLM